VTRTSRIQVTTWCNEKLAALHANGGWTPTGSFQDVSSLMDDLIGEREGDAWTVIEFCTRTSGGMCQWAEVEEGYLRVCLHSEEVPPLVYYGTIRQLKILQKYLRNVLFYDPSKVPAVRVSAPHACFHYFDQSICFFERGDTEAETVFELARQAIERGDPIVMPGIPRCAQPPMRGPRQEQTASPPQ